MTYKITRSGQTYGPYTLTDLQHYVESGSVLLSDLAKSDEMAESGPVSTILETCPAISVDPSNPTPFVGVVFVGFERPVFGTSRRCKETGRAADQIEYVAAMKSRLESARDEVREALWALRAKIASNSLRGPALLGRDFRK